MLIVSVAGGTNAGNRRAPQAKYPNDWKCPSCKARNKYYWRKCPGCGHPRPEEA